MDIWDIATHNQKELLSDFYKNLIGSPPTPTPTTSSEKPTISEPEHFEQLVNMIRSGLLISDLTNKEKKILKSGLGKEWKTILQL